MKVKSIAYDAESNTEKVILEEVALSSPVSDSKEPIKKTSSDSWVEDIWGNQGWIHRTKDTQGNVKYWFTIIEKDGKTCNVFMTEDQFKERNENLEKRRNKK